MKPSYLFRKCLHGGSLILLALVLQGGCVVVQDSKNRDNQIRNASKTFVEAYMAKRVLRHKEAVRGTYDELYRLQDSVQQALRDVHTIRDLRATSVEGELQEVKSLENDLLQYIDYAGSDAYSGRFTQLLQSPDVQQSADELYRMLYLMRAGNSLPEDYMQLKAMARERNTFLFNLQEYLNKRSLTASQAYRNWAELYRLKGMELHKAVLQDRRFTMSDLERVETERLAEKYLALSLSFIEKSDSLLAAGKEAGNPWKTGAEIKLRKHLRLENLAH